MFYANPFQIKNEILAPIFDDNDNRNVSQAITERDCDASQIIPKALPFEARFLRQAG